MARPPVPGKAQSGALPPALAARLKSMQKLYEETPAYGGSRFWKPPPGTYSGVLNSWEVSDRTADDGSQVISMLLGIEIVSSDQTLNGRETLLEFDDRVSKSKDGRDAMHGFGRLKGTVTTLHGNDGSKEDDADLQACTESPVSCAEYLYDCVKSRVPVVFSVRQGKPNAKGIAYSNLNIDAVAVE